VTNFTAKRPLPKDELREDAREVFNNSDDAAENVCLTNAEIGVGAFKAAFFDDPKIQAANICFS